MSKNAVMPMEDYVAACDSIREKTKTTEAIKSGEIPEKINEVYETGKNTEWKALKGFATGTDALCISDISPVEHEMGVKVSGVEDLSAVKVRKYGGNLLDFPSTYSWKGLYSAHANTNVKTVLKPNIRYALSYDEIEYSAQGDGLVFVVNGNAILAWTEAKKPNYFVLDKEVTDFYIYTNGWDAAASGNTTATVTNLRIYTAENGYLEYESYIEPTEYTPDADGAVSGVTSLYPATTLMTDTDGAVIDAIYNKDLSKVDDIPERIEAVYDEGQIAGQAQGERELWDLLTNNNTRSNTSKLFAQSGFEYIRPPYKICPTTNEALVLTFSDSKVKKIEAAYFDFSQKTRATYEGGSLYYTFNHCVELEEIEDIGLPVDFYLSSTFKNCTKLKKIAKIRVDENTDYWEPFVNCSALEEVTFEGVIGKNDLNFQWSTKLTKESLDSILSCLKGFQEPTETHTITLGNVNLEKIPNVKKQFAQQKGWTLL